MLRTVASLALLSAVITESVFAQQSSQVHPEETAAVQLVEAANSAIADKDFNRAIASLKQAVKLIPDDMDLRYKLASTLLSADRMPEMWYVLRQAALKNPEHPGIARGLLSFWRMYDQQGLFNCNHENIDKVISVLGGPDQMVKGPDRDRFIWGFLAVEVKHGQETIFQTMDLRGLTNDHLQPREVVSIGTDGRRVPGHRTITKGTSMVEFVLPDERVQEWTQLLSVQRMHGLAERKATVRQIAEGMMTSLAKTNPNRRYRILAVSDDEASVTFEWTAPKTDEHAAQHELVRLFRGAIDVHRVAFVVRGTQQMDAGLRSTWLQIFQDAELKPTDAAKPDRSGESTLTADSRD